MWPLVRTDLRYNLRTIALFHGIAVMGAALLLSIHDERDTPPPLVWLPLVMQGVLTFNLLFSEHAEQRTRLYALLPLSPSTVALARLVRFLLAVVALSAVSAWMLVDLGQSTWSVLSAVLLMWSGCLAMVLLYDRFGLTRVQVGLLLPGLALLALLAAGSSPVGKVAASWAGSAGEALTRPSGPLFAALLLAGLIALHIRLSVRRPLL